MEAHAVGIPDAGLEDILIYLCVFTQGHTDTIFQRDNYLIQIMFTAK